MYFTRVMTRGNPWGMTVPFSELELPRAAILRILKRAVPSTMHMNSIIPHLHIMCVLI